MKGKRFGLSDRTAVILALGLLLAAGLFAMLWPHSNFSDAERRYLSSAPSAPSLTAWKTDRETESWLSDRIPFRSVLVGVDACAEVLTGRRTLLETWPAAVLVGVDACAEVLTGRRTLLETWPAAGAFLEQPVNGSAKTAERRLQQFGALAEKLDAPWQIVVPRTHGWLLRGKMNSLLGRQYESENGIYQTLEKDEHFIDVLPEGTNAEEVYYRTDHHWNLEGVYRAYTAVCEVNGLPVYALEDYRVSRFEGFFGTTRSRSGLPAFRGDVLECAEPKNSILMTLESGETYDHLIFPERAQTYDGYAVYLDGNHGLLEITNPEAPGGTLLVFKDSFANCLLPLLAADFQRIVAVDARYYSGSFSEAAAAAGEVDAVLFVYSPDSLVNDTAVAGKAGK